MSEHRFVEVGDVERIAELAFGPRARFGDLQYFVCDIDRARKSLGWEPSVRPEEGVPRLLEWVEANRSLFAGEAGAA